MADALESLSEPHRFSDGDLRASDSLWYTRRKRQRQAASNYATLLGRLTAQEEHGKHLAAQHAELQHHFRAQQELNVNLNLRVQMLEKVYIFIDWQKVGSMVADCFASGSGPGTACASDIAQPPGLKRNEHGNENQDCAKNHEKVRMECFQICTPGRDSLSQASACDENDTAHAEEPPEAEAVVEANAEADKGVDTPMTNFAGVAQPTHVTTQEPSALETMDSAFAKIPPFPFPARDSVVDVVVAVPVASHADPRGDFRSLPSDAWARLHSPFLPDKPPAAVADCWLSASALHYRLYKGTMYEKFCDKSEWDRLDREAG